ncbi:MAG: alanine--tRNA ligase [Bacteroidota bacterium]
MKANEIRTAFLEFFRERSHKIVPSAPIVNKDDPTLMFTNAGMNQFKDFFLGNQVPDNRRIADTQKCMRVSGKHNDLEDVGRDGTHHTMFEMLGNWSIGDYFKEEAIGWSWEFLTEKMGIEADRLYATIFEGAPEEGVPADEEAKQFWLRYLPEDRILYYGKKDNFWEMGETGPCGPCTEIHVDTRSEDERQTTPGRELVNIDDSGVVEIWNNVFIQFDRKADGSLESLPEKHVDTGMGFERLCMILQGKKATYDTDIFTPLLKQIEAFSQKTYTGSYAPDAKIDMAMRVVSDHLRAVAFTIADGQLPSNTGAGYVVRRILRRAVRYYYSFLDINQPFLHQLLPTLVDEMGDAFPELKKQADQIGRVIEGEEKAFLNTLENGIRRFEALVPTVKDQQISGQEAFELYDTFGFPIDLTRLMASEQGLSVDEVGFEAALKEQKERSRADAIKQVGDWTVIDDQTESRFVGYDQLVVADARLLKYRTVQAKGKNQYQVVLNQTPFYGESGGQIGDRGIMKFGEQTVKVLDTQKENDLTIHILSALPEEPTSEVHAQVDTKLREATCQNHTAAHLFHAAIHEVLGEHALQKGQDVRPDKMRFDFAHFERPTDEEIAQIEARVNEQIRRNIPLQEQRSVPIDEARNSGALMLFGEKYGDEVRIITFDPNYSRELCGGTHVNATGELGYFKIITESSLAAGIRRVEAVTGAGAEAYLNDQLTELDQIRTQFKGSTDLVKSVGNLQEENRELKKQVEQLKSAQAQNVKGELKSQFEQLKGINFLAAKVDLDAASAKDLAFQLERELDNAFILLASDQGGKALLTLAISKELTESHDLHAGNLIRTLAKEVQGGGGGQPFFATAGGKNPGGIPRVLALAKQMVSA